MAASDVSRDGTAQGLAEFFDYLAERGLMNRATATARKTAATKVLGIDEGWEATDLRLLDLDEQFERFTRLQKQEYKPDSLAVYGSRFRSAVREYLSYLDDPSSFRVKQAKPATKRAGTGSEAKEQQEATDVRDESLTADEPATVAPPQQQKLVTYPFPLRGTGMMAYLQLPPDLKEGEAKRLGRYLEALAIPDEQTD